MSWPAVGGSWPVGTSVPAAGGQDMNMMTGQFTPEQWAAMQQQNWQQWTQWQQQYAQWQSQYGEKYAEMQAMAMGGSGGPAPPLPTQPCQPAPPPPEKPPPPPHENNQPLFQSAGAAKPVPPVSNAMLQHNQGNHQTQDNSRDPNSWNSSRPERNANTDWNTSDKNYTGNSKDNWNNPNDWKQNSNQGDWNRNQKQIEYQNQNPGNWNRNQNDWKANNSQNWSSDGPGSGKAGFDKAHQKTWGETGASHVNSEALKKHEEEERLFDIQFQKWEEEFDKWKQQNINHPDKKAYADYEQKFETCRAQLMERRQQMKQKKIKLMGNSDQTPKKDPPLPANKDPIQAPPQNYNHYGEPDKNSQYTQESSQFDQYNYTPGGNSNDSFNTNSNFLSSSEQRKGIPGLDLVDEEDSAKIPPSNDQMNVIDITDDPPAKTEQDLSAISKGIVNNILGDEKILNMLSIVKGQMHPNNACSGDFPANSGPYDIPGSNSGPMSWQNQNFQGQNRPNQNFPNQNRDGSVINQQRGFNNTQMQPGGPRNGPMGNNMQQGRMGDIPPGRMGDMPPGRMGDMPPGRMGDMPPGRMGDIPTGRMGDMPPGRMGDIPTGRMGDMPPGRKGDMPPGRMGDMPPGRMGDMPPGRMGDMPPGRMRDMLPGRMSDMPPGRMGNIHLGRMGDMPPGRMGDMPPGRMGDMPPGRMGDMPPGRMGDMPPGRMGDMPPGRMSDMPPGRMGDMPPGRMGDMLPGRMSDMPPGRMGDIPPGRMGDMPPGRMGDIPPGRMGDMPPGRMSDMPPGRMGDMQRGSNFPGTNYNSGPGRSDMSRPPRQGSNYENTGPQFRGRPDFPPHPDGLRRGNDFNQGTNFGGSPRPSDPDFGPRADTMRHGDDFQSSPNSGPQPNLDRPEFPPRGENRGQDFQNSPMGRPNMGINSNMRPQPNIGPQNQDIQRNIDMGIQRPDMFMTQDCGRGYGPVMQQDRMGPNIGMQGSNQFTPNQGGIQPLMGSKIDPPEGLIKGQSSIVQGPTETEEAPHKWIEETILEPSIIVDYEHKPLRMKVRDFIEPVQTFDYNHISKDDSKKGIKPGDRWSELDTYNQRSGTKVIDYKNRSLNEPPSDLARRRYDRESDRRDRLEDRRRDDRKDDRRREDRPDDRRRDDRMRHERYRGRDERISPDNRSRERVDWSRKDRDRDRDSHRPERSKEKPRDQSIESVKSAKPEKTTQDTPASNATNPVVMIDDLLDPPGRDVRPEKIVIILRGIPGSGKSYLAKLIKDREMQNGGSAPRILSIDDYFIQEVEVEETDPVTGKMIKKSSNQYVYDERQEENYLNSLKRAYRRTIADHFFPFIIVDACNEQVKTFAELWNFGRQNGFQVYLCTLECDVQTAFKRNIHKRTLEDLQVIAARFTTAPKNYVTIDPTTLLQSAAIQEVHMEDVNSDDDVIMEDAMEEPEQEPLDHFTSKWERMEDSDRLARLDGTSKPLRPSQFSLDEYLQLDDWQPQRTAQPGKKMVRWADIEERRQQEKMRAIGFVVGQTDWNRMTDPTLGSSALTQTKYIERMHRPYK